MTYDDIDRIVDERMRRGQGGQGRDDYEPLGVYCPNPDCIAFGWHGAPKLDTHNDGRITVCEGSWAWNKDGTRKEGTE